MCLLLLSSDTANLICEPGYEVCNPMALLNALASDVLHPRYLGN